MYFPSHETNAGTNVFTEAKLNLVHTIYASLEASAGGARSLQMLTNQAFGIARACRQKMARESVQETCREMVHLLEALDNRFSRDDVRGPAAKG